ncbi:MAG: DinB family protein [Ignavibacteriaceae bacterium]
MKNKSILLLTGLIITLLSLGFVVLNPHEKNSNETEMSSFQSEFLGQVDFVKGRIISLLEAVPEEKFSYRPAEGVRSLGEIYRHINMGNYAAIVYGGYELPNGIKLDWENFEKAETDKAKIKDELSKSFDMVKDKYSKVSAEDLETKVQFFGMEMSRRNFMITMLNHMHEHLGQSIAYARMNGITPPWSKSENEN